MRKTLSKKKARKVLEILGIKKGKVDVIKEEGFKIYIINEKPLLVERKDRIVKSITYFLLGGELKYVKVDKNAVPRILSGADVLRPGILEFSNFSEGESVAILDENDNILGVGISLVSSEKLNEMKVGKVIKNIYTLRDKVWEIEKNLHGKTDK